MCEKAQSVTRKVAHATRKAKYVTLPRATRSSVAHASSIRGDRLAGEALPSCVPKQRHETKVHVLLDMAVKQRQARLIGDQIHRRAPKCRNDHRILPDTGGRLAVEFDELEQVPVDMQRVRIVAAIVEHQPVSASL